MTVILTNGNSTHATNTLTKTIPTPTTISKTIKIANQPQLQTTTTTQHSSSVHAIQLSQQSTESAQQQNKLLYNTPEPANEQKNQQSLVNAKTASSTSTASAAANSTSVSEEEDELNRISLNEANPMPNFGSINITDASQLPTDCSLTDLKTFENIYSYHCKKILSQVVDLKSNAIEQIWRSFWRVPHSNMADVAYYEEQLSMSKFTSLCEVPRVIEWVKQSDFFFYQFCVEILIPDVFGVLPPQLVQAIRNLAKCVENWMRGALVHIPEQMRNAKMNVISTFSMTLRRYTSLNHLAQTVKNSMLNPGVLVNMLSDVNKVDFNYIRVRRI